MAILAAGALLVAVLVARALAGPDPLTQPVADGCTRDRGAIFTHDVPNWAYVNDKDHPASGPPAPQQWAHGVAQSAYDPEMSAHPTGVDDPFTHTSYDFVFNLRADPADSALLAGSEADGTGNYAGKDEETGRLHTERESGTFPSWAWPDAGDRVAVRGAWVWDCDHAGPTGERTEIHPFHAIFVQRNPSPSSPYGDAEGDVFVTNAKTPADRQAECAHQTKGDRASFKTCVATSGGETIDVSGSYELFMKAPARPSKSAKLTYRVVDKGSANAPALRVTPEANGVSLSFDVAASTAPLELVKQVFVGWRPMPAKKLPVHLQVRLRELLVRRAMDPGCPLDNPKCTYANETTRVGQYSKSPGEWNVYTDVGGVWSQWTPAVVRPHDGQRIKSRQKVDFYVASGKPWRLFAQTRECDFGSVGNAYSPAQPVTPCPRANEIGNPVGDDEPGILADHFRSPTARLGVHTSNSRLEGSTCPRSNKHGCYALTYSVRRVSSPHR